MASWQETFEKLKKRKQLIDGDVTTIGNSAKTVSNKILTGNNAAPVTMDWRKGRDTKTISLLPNTNPNNNILQLMVNRTDGKTLNVNTETGERFLTSTQENRIKTPIELLQEQSQKQLEERKTEPKAKSDERVEKKKQDEKEEEKKWYQKIFEKGEFDDGYDFGDVTKTILGTSTELTQKAAKGILKVAEAPVDIATNLVGTGANIIGQDEAAKKIRNFADKDLSENISKIGSNASTTGMLYNLVNGTPEKIINPAGVEWDKDKGITENYFDNLNKALTDEKETQNYEESSLSGYYADHVTEQIGYILGLVFGGGLLSKATGTKTATLTTKTGKTVVGASASGGNIGLTLGKRTLNIPTLALAGGMSSGLQEANSKEDVTEAERWTKGISSGMIEGVTEGLFGMFGVGGVKNEAGREVFDALGEQGAKLFSSRAGKTLANVGIRSAGEPIEEFLSFAGNYFVDNNIIDKMGEADFSKDWDWGEVGEQMALAYATSLIMQGGGNVIETNSAIAEAEKQLGRELTSNEKAIVTQASLEGALSEKINYIENGRNVDTGLTSNEQSVLNSVTEQRTTELQKQKAVEERINKVIEEQEATRGTLTDEAKQEIKNRVMQEDIDFTTSKLSKKEIAKIEQEVREDLENGEIDIDTIESTLSSEKTAQIKELKAILDKSTNPQEQAQIQAQINELESAKATELRDMLQKDVLLQNSYREANLRNERFTYETKSTDSEYKKALAEDFKKIADNTTKSHKTFEMISKIAEDKGTAYGIINNEQLKNLNYDVDGKDINGLVRKNEDGSIKVLINIDSKKAINRIVGHETTHLLEGTKEYDELKEFAEQYATTKGEYNSRHEKTQKLYEGVKNADIEAEVTADIVGDYLFTDQTFINNLSVEKPTIFQKIYNEIKHLYNLATAGSTEQRQLLQLKKSFEKAYRENGVAKATKKAQKTENIVQNTTEADVKYSIQQNEDGSKYVKVDTDQHIFDGKTIAEQNKIAKEYILKAFRDKGLMVDGKEVNVNNKTATKYTNPRENISNSKKRVKNRISTELDNLLDVSELTKTEADKKNHSFAKDGWEYYLTNFKVDNIDFTGIVNIGVNGENRTLYDINQIKKTTHNDKAENSAAISIGSSFNEDIITQNGKKVKYSKTDNKGRTLSKQQLEKFKDSKARDENGNLLTLYHGTKADFNVFENNLAGENYDGWSYSGKGFYFTDSETEAKEFGDYSLGDGETQIKEVYLNITNPFDTSKDYTNELQDLAKEYNIDEYFLKRGDSLLSWFRQNKINASEILKEYGYDGVIDFGHYMVYEPNQIKNVDNIAPTESEDIRYSLSETNLKEQQLDIILKNNPAEDDYHTWIRNVDDIKTFEETLQDDDWAGWEESGFDPDYDADMVKEALETGKITVYSSYPIDLGIFVSPSRMEAESYSGNGKVYSKEVNLTDVAWVDPTQGQYAPVENDNFSLSNSNEQTAPSRNDVYGSDIKYQVAEAIAPLQAEIKELREQISKPTTQEAESNFATDIESDIQNYTPAPLEVVERQQREAPLVDEAPVRYNLTPEESQELDVYENIPLDLTSEEQQRITELQNEQNLTPDNEVTESESLFDVRDYSEVGKRNINAYQYDNPEVKPYFQDMARAMLQDLKFSTKGERVIDANVLYDTNGKSGIWGTKRDTADDIAQMLDGVDGKYKLSYKDIEKGLNAIIQDEGAENNVASKRIEFFIDQRLRNGYTDFFYGDVFEPDQGYLNLVSQDNRFNIEEQYNEWLNTLPKEVPNDYAPFLEMAKEINPESQELNNVKLAPVEKNTLDWIPQDPTKESTYDEPRVYNPIDAFVDDQVAKRLTNKAQTTPKVEKQKGDGINTLNYLFVNRNEAIDRFSDKTGNKDIKILADHVNNVYGEISTNIGKAQIDNNGKTIGKGLTAIFEQARKKGLSEAFDDYLFHKSNIARHKNNKGSVVPGTESSMLVIEYEKTYPDFKKWGNEVNTYNRNNLYKQADAGLITKELANRIVNMYDFYVPFFENVERQFISQDTGELKSRAIIKRARGGADKNLLNFEQAMMQQTQSTITAIRKNQLYNEIIKSSNEKTTLGTGTENINSLYNDGSDYYLTAYKDGNQVSAKISEDLYKGLNNELEQRIKNFEQRFSKTFKTLQTISNVRRNLLTNWSPSFIITNPIKDLQDAPLNSKYAKDWAMYYPVALKELTTGKGKQLETFLNMYGQSNLMGDYSIDSGVSDITKIKGTSGLSKVSVARLNEIAELVPRYAEYLASIKNGTSQMEALYNAREVTTNFGRGGVITKALNRNGFTFLNASVQGFNKLYRNFKTTPVRASLKALSLGVAPALFNALMYGLGDEEDEDYKALPDYIKDNYYLIKTDDGNFIRIPKGRMISVFGSAARRTLELSQGETDAFDGYLKNAYSQVGVSNPMESNILAPLIQAYGSENGKSWYGEDIVPTRLQDVPKDEQYDEGTDKFSIWLGEKLGISPIKANYVIDQYTGGIGDLALPMITEEAKSDGSLLAPLKDKFTADSITDNKYVSEFYTKNDEMKVKANSSKATEEDLLINQYMKSVSSEMGALYSEMREVQSDKRLSKKEKYEKAQAIKKQINALAKEGLDGYTKVNKVENYAEVGGREFYKFIDDETGETVWAKPKEEELDELNAMGLEVEEKGAYYTTKSEIYDIKDAYAGNDDYAGRKKEVVEAIINSNLTDDAKYYLYDNNYGNEDDTKAVRMLDLDADTFLTYASQTFTADKDENGKSISGSKKAKVFDYINSMTNIDWEQRAILAKLQYNTYDEWNYEIIDYLNNSPVSYEEMEFILKQMGFEVSSDGTITWE